MLLLTAVGLALGLLLPVEGRTPHKCVGYLTLALAAFPLTAALWRPRAVAVAVAGVEASAGTAAATATAAAESTAAADEDDDKRARRRRRLWEGCHRACGLAAIAAAFVDGALGVRRTGMRPRCLPAAIMVSQREREREGRAREKTRE